MWLHIIFKYSCIYDFAYGCIYHLQIIVVAWLLFYVCSFMFMVGFMFLVISYLWFHVHGFFYITWTCFYNVFEYVCSVYLDIVVYISLHMLVWMDIVACFIWTCLHTLFKTYVYILFGHCFMISYFISCLMISHIFISGCMFAFVYNCWIVVVVLCYLMWIYMNLCYLMFFFKYCVMFFLL